jgi:hypothetical protein
MGSIPFILGAEATLTYGLAHSSLTSFGPGGMRIAVNGALCPRGIYPAKGVAIGPSFVVFGRVPRSKSAAWVVMGRVLVSNQPTFCVGVHGCGVMTFA